MEKPSIRFQDIGDDARRQYVDARATFEAQRAAQLKASAVRGGMYWKNVAQGEYLVRTSVRNAQKSLGPRSAETEAMYASFTQRKQEAEARLKDLSAALTRQQRLNRALFVGRVPALVVALLDMLEQQGVAEHFTVVGTHALYAYEAAAGVRVESAAVATTVANRSPSAASSTRCTSAAGTTPPRPSGRSRLAQADATIVHR